MESVHCAWSQGFTNLLAPGTVKKTLHLLVTVLSNHQHLALSNDNSMHLLHHNVLHYECSHCYSGNTTVVVVMQQQQQLQYYCNSSDTSVVYCPGVLLSLHTLYAMVPIRTRITKICGENICVCYAIKGPFHILQGYLGSQTYKL